MVSRYLINTGSLCAGMFAPLDTGMHVDVSYLLCLEQVRYVISRACNCEIEIEIFHCDSSVGLARSQNICTALVVSRV